jgi:hypothetical protein
MHEIFRKQFDKNIENTMSRGSEDELHKIFEGLSALKKLLRDEEK